MCWHLLLGVEADRIEHQSSTKGSKQSLDVNIYLHALNEVNNTKLTNE